MEKLNFTFQYWKFGKSKIHPRVEFRIANNINKKSEKKLLTIHNYFDILIHASDGNVRINKNIKVRMEKYSRGRRGAPAKGIGR